MFNLTSNLWLFSPSQLHMGFMDPNTFTITPGNGCRKATAQKHKVQNWRNRKAWPHSDIVQNRQYHPIGYKMLCPLPSILQDFSTDNKGKGMTGDILSGQNPEKQDLFVQ